MRSRPGRGGLLDEVAAGAGGVEGVEGRVEVGVRPHPEADAADPGLVGHDRLEHLHHHRRAELGQGGVGVVPVVAGPPGRGGDAEPRQQPLALVLPDGNGETLRHDEADGRAGRRAGGPGPGVVDQRPDAGDGAGHAVVGGDPGGGQGLPGGGDVARRAAGGHHEQGAVGPEPVGGRSRRRRRGRRRPVRAGRTRRAGRWPGRRRRRRGRRRRSRPAGRCRPGCPGG